MIVNFILAMLYGLGIIFHIHTSEEITRRDR